MQRWCCGEKDEGEEEEEEEEVGEEQEEERMGGWIMFCGSEEGMINERSFCMGCNPCSGPVGTPLGHLLVARARLHAHAHKHTLQSLLTC